MGSPFGCLSLKPIWSDSRKPGALNPRGRARRSSRSQGHLLSGTGTTKDDPKSGEKCA